MPSPAKPVLVTELSFARITEAVFATLIVSYVIAFINDPSVQLRAIHHLGAIAVVVQPALTLFADSSAAAIHSIADITATSFAHFSAAVSQAASDALRYCGEGTSQSIVLLGTNGKLVGPI